MEDEKKNSKTINQPNVDCFQEGQSDEAKYDAKMSNQTEENGEITPTIVKKLHRRQVSTASAKMFALNEDIFSSRNEDSEVPNDDIPQVHFDLNSTDANSKEVTFEREKGDSGISRSINKSDMDGTSDTQITSGIGTVENSIETFGTSRSSMTKGKRPEVKYSKVQGIFFNYQVTLIK